MASEKPTLKVIRAPTALDELDSIWQWNVEQYGVERADEYLGLIKDNIAALARTCEWGMNVPGRPGPRYIIVRRRRKGHGHIVVCTFNESEVRILHVFHTAQNWQAMLD